MRTLFDFGFEIRPALRLSEVEKILRRLRVITPVPSRPTLIALIEDGTFEGRKLSHGWVVYEDSLKAWVKSLQPEAYQIVAPSTSVPVERVTVRKPFSRVA